MKVNVLVFFEIASDDCRRLGRDKDVSPVKGDLCSTDNLLAMARKQVVNKYVRAIILLLFLLPLNLKAQQIPTGTLLIRTNDPAVTVTVDNPMAKVGETVTVTLAGDLTDKTVSVKAGQAFGKEDLTVSDGSTPGTYTFTMPGWNVYIDVVTQPASGEPTSYSLSIETPGVATNKVSIKIEGEGVTDNITTGCRVKAGSKVTVTLQTPLGARLTLTGTEAYAPDGSWRWADLSGKAVTVVTFTMPSAAVTVRFSIHEETTPDDPDDPDDPDNPDIPDNPDDPDNPDNPVANEPIDVCNLHIRTLDGLLWVETSTSQDVAVYTFDGQKVRHLHLAAGGWQQIVLPHRGSYILRYGNRAIKFNL